jgi:hypothetical protein
MTKSSRERRTGMARLRQFESAQLVWDALTASGPDGMTFREILDETDLTRGQVLYGFKLIKDTLMEVYEQPLIYNHITRRYTLPQEWREVRDHLDFRIVGILAMARRLELVANAAGKKWGETDSITRAMKHVTRLREDLEEVAGLREDETLFDAAEAHHE